MHVAVCQQGAGTVLQGAQKGIYRKFGSMPQGFNKPVPWLCNYSLVHPRRRVMWWFLCHGGLLKQPARADGVAWTSNPTWGADQRLLDPHVKGTALQPEAEEHLHLQCSVTPPCIPFSVDIMLRDLSVLYRERWIKRKVFFADKKEEGKKKCEGKSERRIANVCKGVQREDDQNLGKPPEKRYSWPASSGKNIKLNYIQIWKHSTDVQKRKQEQWYRSCKWDSG